MFSVCSIEECALRIYTRQRGEAGLTPARLFYLLGLKMKTFKNNLYIKVVDNVRRHVASQVEDLTKGRVDDQVLERVRFQVGRQVLNQVWNHSCHQMGVQVRRQINNEII